MVGPPPGRGNLDELHLGDPILAGDITDTPTFDEFVALGVVPPGYRWFPGAIADQEGVWASVRERMASDDNEEARVQEFWTRLPRSRPGGATRRAETWSACTKRFVTVVVCVW